RPAAPPLPRPGEGAQKNRSSPQGGSGPMQPSAAQAGGADQGRMPLRSIPAPPHAGDTLIVTSVPRPAAKPDGGSPEESSGEAEGGLAAQQLGGPVRALGQQLVDLLRGQGLDMLARRGRFMVPALQGGQRRQGAAGQRQRAARGAEQARGLLQPQPVGQAALGQLVQRVQGQPPAGGRGQVHLLDSHGGKSPLHPRFLLAWARRGVFPPHGHVGR
ncbi:hypothetical protein HMPREF0731_2339, partial [Pseudoroseomonas cervicalis ATCC 49957]